MANVIEIIAVFEQALKTLHNTDLITDIERLGGVILLFITAIGAAWTAYSVGKKALIDTQTKASVDVSTVEIAKGKADHEIAIAKEKADIENDRTRLELLQQMEMVYAKMTGDTNKRLSSMQLEIDNNKAEHDLALNKLKTSQSETLIKLNETTTRLELVTKERDIFQKAGIRLIHATEEGMKLRAKMSAELNNCNACSISDAALLKALKEVRDLFENGVKDVA